ncbi:MAG: metal ABC transporter ATP-binding protein [Rhodobacteraceae bacterium]|nr:metal ABC transporter ATP-binding protein [Paracoccaceae bacterium]
MSEKLIETRNLGLVRDGRTVLDGVNFSIHPGEIVTIVGPNGSGKSSFLKCLIGALKPTSGKITQRRGLPIGYVPQRLDLDRTLPMQVARFLRLAGGDAKGRLAMVTRLGIGNILDRQLGELSGGQLQRVLLAHALVGAPELLILDEAAQGLDQPAVASFYTLIETVRREIGCAVLMVSHDLHVVMSASDRVICLNRHVCCEGTPTVVSAAPEYRQLFGYGTEGALALYRHEHDHRHDPARETGGGHLDRHEDQQEGHSDAG